jgi:hypothetical protein
MFFNPTEVPADDIIRALLVIYDEGEPNSFHAKELQRRGSLNYQKMIFRVHDDGSRTGFLPDILRKEDSSFRARFLKFITGKSSVPKYQSDYSLTIEFDIEDDLEIVTDTNSNTLSLPGFA